MRYNALVGHTTLLGRIRQRKGWRLTAQRRVIAEVLEGEHVHLTADQIFAEARRRMPEISLGTVYNVLRDLVYAGEVQEVRVAGGAVRYDPNAGTKHHHLICVGCGVVHDVYPHGRLRLPKSQRFGHRIVAEETVFRGYCPRCRARRGAPTNG